MFKLQQSEAAEKNPKPLGNPNNLYKFYIRDRSWDFALYKTRLYLEHNYLLKLVVLQLASPLARLLGAFRAVYAASAAVARQQNLNKFSTH